jgi:hypothetical protein
MTLQVPTRSELALPKGLMELDQWVLWRRELVKGRETKVPYSVQGCKASTTDPRTWADFDSVRDVLRKNRGAYQGSGFVFIQGGGLVGIDLDHCLNADGALKASPSGSGVKIWARGSLPANLPGVRVGDGSIEMYAAGRYFTVTNRVFRGAPLELEDHAADLLLLFTRLTERKRKVWPLQPLQGGRIPYGQQHQTLVSIAGTLRARLVCDEAILACLLAVNAHQCERPGPAENIARIVRSTRAWVAR